MPALKALVIGMALLIVAGLAVVAVTIANRTLDGGGPTDAAFALPPGAEILETALDGGRIALRLRLADGSTAIHVYDLDTGERAAVARIGPDGG
ncbi:MAG: hypothetical protein OXI22_17575 [Defluviicoccus sp.]|nr:hypothetical protein [Defluviicoccus sp.]MDE0385697.1 hypothetical protein [Defluviicoccus sp.]